MDASLPRENIAILYPVGKSHRRPEDDSRRCVSLKTFATSLAVLLLCWNTVAVPHLAGAAADSGAAPTPGPHACWNISERIQGHEQTVKICNITHGAAPGDTTCKSVTHWTHGVRRQTRTCRTVAQTSAAGQCRYYWATSGGQRRYVKQCTMATHLSLKTRSCVTTYERGKKPKQACHGARKQTTEAQRCSYHQSTHGGVHRWTGRTCRTVSLAELTPTPRPTASPTQTPTSRTSTPTATPIRRTATPIPSPIAPSTTPSATATASPGPMSGLHVVGNQIENGLGQPVRFLGVNRAGAESMCIHNKGIFNGPSDAASVAAMASWHINAVRLPLNEDCWLGINGAPPAYSGDAYQQAIENYVALLNSYGLAVILSLQRIGPGTQLATDRQPMPDRDHAPAFWTSVATAFSGNSSVLFDLYNEPWPDSNTGSVAAWQCVRDGGTCPGVSYQAAGMQELVNAVRGTGAGNIILVAGTQYTNDLTYWLQYVPTDPLHNLVASWHSYNGGGCATSVCWNNDIAKIAKTYPVVAGEIGEKDCGHTYIDTLMPWLDAHNIGYLAWTWNTWDCVQGPSLISDYDGTPTPYGIGFQNHLAALTQSPAR